MEPARASFVEVNRVRLRLWEWGEEDAPAIVCVHGAHDHGRMWDGFAPLVAQLGYRVVAPDLRGHGDSGRLSSGAMWMASALDLGLLARHLGPPVAIIGHSFGGGQALYAAAVWPELFRWVVNIDGLGPPPEAFEERDLVEAATASVANALRVLTTPRRTYPTMEDMVERRQRVNVRLPAEWTEHLVRHGAKETEGGWEWKADPFFMVGFPGPFDLEFMEAEHEIVTVPVLALTGAEHDTWSEMTAEQTEARLAHLPTARHQVIEGAGHYIHIEQPAAVLAAIESFIAEVAP
ncbi:MAG TPA: alpha/beta hydrolase [Acidimicrobiales bacterium]